MADDVTVTPCVNGDLQIEGPGFLAWIEPSGCIVVGPDLDTPSDVIASADVPASVMAAVLDHHPTVLDLRRQLEQARRIAVHLEQQMSAVLAPVSELVPLDDRVLWVQPETGACAELSPIAIRARLCMVITAAEAVDRGR